jgi:hypothetical protein
MDLPSKKHQYLRISITRANLDSKPGCKVLIQKRTIFTVFRIPEPENLLLGFASKHVCQAPPQIC